MAKKEQEEVIVDVEELYTKTESWVEQNKQVLLIAVGVVLAIVAGYFYYTRAILQPLEQEAEMEIYKAQQYFAQDSFNLAMYGDAAGNLGFEQIASEYGSTPAGELAHYYMGVSLLRTGDYAGAIDYLEAYSGSDPLIGPNAIGNIGDAYVELGDYETALSYYEKAASMSDNDVITPRYLMKAGKVSEELGRFQEALQFYQQVADEFPSSTEGRSAEKYVARVEAKI